MSRILYKFKSKEVHVFGLLKGHTWVCHLQGREINLSKKYFGNREYARTKNAKGHTSLQWGDPILLLFHKKLCFHYDPHHEALAQNKGV
jgi:hypothetical protein